MKEIQIRITRWIFKVIRLAQIKKFDNSQYCRYEKTGSIITLPGEKLVQPFGKTIWQNLPKAENTNPLT